MIGTYHAKVIPVKASSKLACSIKRSKIDFLFTYSVQKSIFYLPIALKNRFFRVSQNPWRNFPSYKNHRSEILDSSGDVAAWQRGSVAAWQRGSVAAWQRGSVAICEILPRGRIGRSCHVAENK